jgi:alpha-glucoside transport system permease protein
MVSEPKFWEAMRNNMLWLIVVPAASTAFGLLAAQLTDRIKWGNIAKSLIFMPMAISFVGASVIFKLVYDTRPAGQDQIGVLNAVWLAFDGGVWYPSSCAFCPPCSCSPSPPSCSTASITAAAARLGRGHMAAGHGGPCRCAAVVALGGAWLVFLSLKSVYSVFTFAYPYGEPQTWLTIPSGTISS